jgi:membrane-bound lytic murein transglycosylase A
VGAGLVAILLVLRLCSLQRFGTEAPDTVSQPEHIQLADDLDRDSLDLALQRSLDYVRRLPPERLLPLSDRQITASTLRQTLETFQHLLHQAPTVAALHAALHEQFDFVQASGRQGRGDVLFTGYYEPVLSGSLAPTERFTYPLYMPPPDLIHIDLARFRPEWTGERLVAQYRDGQIVPYFTRREIDVEAKLQGRGLELVWLPDIVDAFFLHIQGSGHIRLPNGQDMRVHYAASNGHPYRSIGKLLLDEARISPNAITMQQLRQYLRTHPGDRERVLNHNPRYIFFHQVDEGPIGRLGFALVPGRSIATDPRLFPASGLAFIQTQQPVLNASHEVIGWQPLSRFVFNHDSGSAIKGPGRVDLYWGSGTPAEAAAGRLKHEGRLFFLLKRPLNPDHP